MDYRISNGRMKAVVSSAGAELQSLVCGDNEYLWNGDPVYWNERSPLLFPYVGRLTGGKYRYREKEYEMDIHGFARRMEFRAVVQEPDRLLFEINDTPRTYAAYPFRFSLGVGYELLDSSLKVSYRVENRSRETIYFGIGAHPGFRVPLEDGLVFEDYCLEFGRTHRPDRVGHTEECFLSGQDREYGLEQGRRIPLRHELFDDDAIVLKNVADEVTLKSDRGSRMVTLSYPGLPYLGIWHVPHKAAPYVCIEPWTSLPSRQDIVEDIEFKNDLIRLKSGELYKTSWRITVR